MSIHLTPALSLSLEQIAAETHTSPEELTQSTMEAFVAEYEEVREAVRQSDAEFERGDFLSHEEVVARFAKRFTEA
jgi:predicted transcriptional regulator